MHGLEGKYLFDAENCTTRFDSEEFRKILRLTRIFIEREHQGTSEDVRQGTSPCAVAYIGNPADLSDLRVWGEEKLRFIGYPSGGGLQALHRGGMLPHNRPCQFNGGGEAPGTQLFAISSFL